MPETFYDVLDVPPDASEATIEEAYRSTVKDVHPDVSDRDDATERFKLVRRAVEVLTDAEKRRRYDRLGHEQYVRLNGSPELHDLDETEAHDRSTTVEEATAWATQGRPDDTSETGSGPTNRDVTAGWREQERRWQYSNVGGSRDFAGSHRTGHGDRATDFGARHDAHTTADGADLGDVTDPGFDPATESTESSAASQSSDSRSTGGGYAVRDWGQARTGRSVLRTDWSQETPGFFIGTFLLYPIMLASSVYPGFPFEANLVIAATTLFMAGYLLTRPGLSAPIFGAWGVLLPLWVAWSSYHLLSLLGLVAVLGTWIPFLYSVTIGLVLREPR